MYPQTGLINCGVMVGQDRGPSQEPMKGRNEKTLMAGGSTSVVPSHNINLR